MLAVVASFFTWLKVWPGDSNFTQQHTTTCNSVCKRTQHAVTSSNVSCVSLHTGLKNEEGNYSRNESRSWFWDRYWWHAGQLLAKFSLSLVTVPEVFAKVISSQFPSYFWSGELHYKWINEWKEGGGGVRLGIQKVALSELALHVNYTFFLGSGKMFRVDTPSAEAQTGNYAEKIKMN